MISVRVYYHIPHDIVIVISKFFSVRLVNSSVLEKSLRMEPINISTASQANVVDLHIFRILNRHHQPVSSVGGAGGRGGGGSLFSTVSPCEGQCHG